MSFPAYSTAFSKAYKALPCTEREHIERGGTDFSVSFSESDLGTILHQLRGHRLYHT